jgi:hypothetical protein
MRTEVGGKLVVIGRQRISPLREKPSDGVEADEDTEVSQRHGNLVGSSPRPVQPGDGIAERVVFEQKLDQDDDLGGFGLLAAATGTARGPS